MGLATASQIAGSLASVALAAALVKAFSGKGLLPPDLLTTGLLAAVALGAALTVAGATRFGLPISTTHAIVGALVGAGAVRAGAALDLAALSSAFALPLAVGPVIAVALAWLLLRGGRAGADRLGLARGDCVCVGPELTIAPGVAASTAIESLGVTVAPSAECRAHDDLQLAGVDLDRALHRGHVLSATAVGFARGLNDTPKILGLLVGAAVIDPTLGALVLGVAMALGGWFAARRVADTLALKLTPMHSGQGFAANLATSILVIGASHVGVPVSTTHVSTGGILGIGAAARTLQRRKTREILGAWVGTLPVAAALGALLAWNFA